VSQTVTTRCATLRDGRRLSYVSIGPADGLLVLYLHGAIGSPQAICPELEAIVCDLRLRYVMVSRPGFGSSPPAAGRTLLGFARDAAALADGLGHERFTVLGVSAGGPYALACAHELPERVAAAAVVSCLAPGTCSLLGRPAPARAALRALRTHPGACARAGDAAVRIAQGHPRFVARVMRAAAAPADRRQLAGPEASEGASARFLAAAGGGVQGLIDDHLLCARPWGFRPEAVSPLVDVWHGAQDRIVPVEDVLLLAAALPRARIALGADEGHFFFHRRRREILVQLADAARQSSKSGRGSAASTTSSPSSAVCTMSSSWSARPSSSTCVSSRRAFS